ncbi:MAG: preprotein translocase subunit SecD [Haloferacaceae archaeon]
MMDVRDNWRVLVLVLVLAASTFALLGPTAGGSTTGPGTASDDPTNLKYGLQLSGGTRIRAPLAGVTAEGVEFGDDDPATVARRVAAELENVSVADVNARRAGTYAGERVPSNAVEVTTDGVTTDELAAALDAAGYPYGGVREGVTAPTRQETVEVLRSKINEAGLSGGTVQVITTPTGGDGRSGKFVLVEVPNADRQEVIDLVTEEGTVTVQAYYPVEENGTTVYRRETVMTRETFQNIGTARQGQRGTGPNVPVTINDSDAPSVQETLVRTGVAQRQDTNCRYRTEPNRTDPCLLLVVDGEVVNSFGMDGDLGRSMISGEWQKDPRFILTTRNFSEAREVAINLRAGSLPAPLELGGTGEGTSSYISPSQGQSFKTNSLLTAIVAVFAVSGVVFLRYGSPRVALPMIVTALSEVVILLGLAAGIGYPLDLSVIAGFIAVIGTGVDDLIIIADEVMAEGEVNSRRVFKSRFRKAFWVIGVAAATTIIAMSPLAVLGLGDLAGFAYFTIFGVIVGVLLTRPAYGDILRSLMTGR